MSLNGDEQCFSVRPLCHPEVAPTTHWTGDWVGPGAGLDVVAERTFLATASNLTHVMEPVGRHASLSLTQTFQLLYETK
jgi:hypothetical protein